MPGDDSHHAPGDHGRVGCGWSVRQYVSGVRNSTHCNVRKTYIADDKGIAPDHRSAREEPEIKKGSNTMNKEQIAEKVKDLLCTNLGIDRDMLTNEIYLFGDEIGLDSIDSLEIIAAVDEEFGVSLTGVGKEPFYSVDTLTDYIAEHQ